MQLTPLDWILICLYFAISLWIGLRGARKSGSSADEFFLSGRNMPWWLLGVSMVATTFSCDTPNLVTDIVRRDGVAGNWVWWAFLLTGMLTVFVYAKMWRRSGVMTDLEFYELRYAGREAAFLRAFRALYLGVFFNVMIMAAVSLAAIKIGRILFDVPPYTTLLVASLVTVAYSTVGGFRAVLLTDFFQFIIAMIGSVGAAWVVLHRPEVGGLQALFAHPNVADKLHLLPDFNNLEVAIPLFLMPIAVQWWSVWYPGAEPGGGGYVAQRMLAAKNEQHALGATLFFNVAHYALRPWPWILVGLASLIMFPTLADIQRAFPNVEADKIGHDLGYSAMLTYLPAGLVGIVVASLAAAFMSTIATHLNWGSSYIVNDFWKRFVEPTANDRKLVAVGRISTVLLMLLASVVAVQLESAKGAFDILLQIGAGTGLLFILRWFWWRVNAAAELVAMAVSFLVAVVMQIAVELPGWQELLLGVGITTITWLIACFVFPETPQAQLLIFYKKIQPATLGWKPVIQKGLQSGELMPGEVRHGGLGNKILCMMLGVFGVYAALFATGYLLYGQMGRALLGAGIAALLSFYLFKRLKYEV